MRYQFTKMQSLGNDFVVLDGVSQKIEMSGEMALKVADRHFGIGCDQILIAEPADHSDVGFRFRIFNSDGSEVGQCGNGARCFARFLVDQGLTTERSISVQTLTTAMVLEINDDDTVTVDMGQPIFKPEKIPFVADKESCSYQMETTSGVVDIVALSVGNPHGVQIVENVRTADVENIGPLVECHERFPQRTNAGFMEIVSREHIRLRVYERGAGETLGCGSGACAAAVAGIQLGLLDSKVTVSLPGGDAIVEWQGQGYPICLTGSAETVFTGVIEL